MGEKTWRAMRISAVLAIVLVVVAVAAAILGGVWLRRAMGQQLPTLDGRRPAPRALRSSDCAP